MIIRLSALFAVVSCIRAWRTAPFDLTRYSDFPDFERFLVHTAKANAPIAKLLHIGNSHEGRALMGLKIGRPQKWRKPLIWLDGGNHAREWPAFHTAVFFIQQLINEYDRDEQITEYVNTFDFLIFPVLNPDGFVFSRSSHSAMIRHWRKNRAPENCTGTTGSRKDVCCEGVDLNRNYDFAFKQTNYPFNNPCSDEFQGPHPFSEPESRAVRDFILSPDVNGRLHALVSLHTHGQLFILPYNNRKRTYPEDYQDLKDTAIRAAHEMSKLRGIDYQVGTAADLLGPATGGATDWIKKNTKVKYVYVLELPPDLKTWFAFQVKPHWLLPIGKETWAGVKVIINQVMDEFVEKR